MKYANVLTLNSSRLINSTIRYAIFVKLSYLVTVFQRLPGAEKNAHRSERARELVQSFDRITSEFWALFAEALERGINIDFREEVEKLTGRTSPLPDEKQMAAVADATGISISTIRAKAIEDRARELGRKQEAMSGLIARLEEREFVVTDEDEVGDIDIKASAVLGQLEKLGVWLGTWSKPDYAELILLKQDRIRLEEIAEREDALEQGAGPDMRLVG